MKRQVQDFEPRLSSEDRVEVWGRERGAEGRRGKGRGGEGRGREGSTSGGVEVTCTRTTCSSTHWYLGTVSGSGESDMCVFVWGGGHICCAGVGGRGAEGGTGCVAVQRLCLTGWHRSGGLHETLSGKQQWSKATAVILGLTGWRCVYSLCVHNSVILVYVLNCYYADVYMGDLLIDTLVAGDCFCEPMCAWTWWFWGLGLNSTC